MQPACTGPTIFIAVPKPRHSASLPSPHPHPSPLPFLFLPPDNLFAFGKRAPPRRLISIFFARPSPLSLLAFLNVKIRCVCVEDTEEREEKGRGCRILRNPIAGIMHFPFRYGRLSPSSPPSSLSMRQHKWRRWTDREGKRRRKSLAWERAARVH